MKRHVISRCGNAIHALLAFIARRWKFRLRQIHIAFEMPTPVELSLSTLLPTVSFLPPELISLASSLLAQSRAKAPQLKAEEEIGRTYACAHIACERLSKRLGIDVEKPAPPVKPRVYDKLKGFLDGVLLAEPRTPKRDRVGPVFAKNDASVANKVELKTPTSGVKRAREPLQQENADDDVEVPDFAMPLIHRICKACNLPAAAPHVLVGATSVAREIASRVNKRAVDGEPSSKRRKTGRPLAVETAATPSTGGAATIKWPALLVAIHICTASKILSLASHDPKKGEIRTKAIDGVTAFCSDKRRKVPESLSSQLSSLESSVAFYLLEAEDCGWLDMEWYSNIPTATVAEDTSGDTPDEETGIEQGPITSRRPVTKTPLRRKEKHGRKAGDWTVGEEDTGAAGLLPGLGTMFQAAVDWLSEERRAGFAVWKRSILRELAALEAEA